MEARQAMQGTLAEAKAQQQKWEVVKDNRPSDYIYALMSNHVYQGTVLAAGKDCLPDYPNWKVVATKHGDSEYFGVLYFNQNDNHYVLAHRGTNSLAAWIEDFKGIYLGKISPQKRVAYDFVTEAVTKAKLTEASLSFTGHSLGAFLAELSVFYCHRSLKFPNVNAVTFESPGSYETLASMQPHIQGQELDLARLDVIGYLSYPNLINTCNHHIGTLYQLNPNLGNYGWMNVWFTYQAHSMGGIVDIFEENDRPTTAKFLVDWPMGNQLQVFYTEAKFKDGHYEQKLTDEEGNKLFKLEYEAHYGVEHTLSKPHLLPLRHFGLELQSFLLVFHQWKEDIRNQEGEPSLSDKIKAINPEEFRNYLLNFSLSQRKESLQKDSAEMVRLSEGQDIKLFRQKISAWLTQLKKREQLIGLMQKNVSQNSTLEAISELASEGSRIGILKNSKAIVAKVSIPQDASPQDVANAKELIAQFQEGGGKYIARAFAPNSIVGYAENVEARTFDIQVGSSSSTTPLYDRKRKRTEETLPHTQKLTQSSQSLAGGSPKVAVFSDQPVRKTGTETAKKRTVTVVDGQAGHVSGVAAVGSASHSIIAPNAHFHLLTSSTSLPPIPNQLIAASSCFVGREKELDTLENLFKKKDLVIVGILGQAGCGKSQLAAEYAHHSKISQKPYHLIRWLKADSEESLKSAYFALGDDLGIKRKDYKDSEAAFKNAINCQLLRYERVLLIYDNLESSDYIDSYKPSSGEKTAVHLIFTTRNRFTNYSTVETKEFDGQAIQSYLNHRLKKDISLELADKLGQELGYLPLAIVQSAAHMVKYEKPLESFINLLKTEGSREKALNAGDAKLKAIETLWNITLEKLSPKALELVRFCIYLDPDNIPRTLLEQFMAGESDDVLFEVRNQSLLLDVGEGGEFFRIHRLLQEVVRRQSLNQNTSAILAKALVEKGISALKLLIGEDRYKPLTDFHLFWKKHDFIALQVNYLIKEAERLKVNGELLANLLEWAGDHHQHITLNYEESLNFYQRSLTLRKAIYGDNHASVADALLNIGDVNYTQSHYDEALKNYKLGLTILKTAHGEPHPSVATSLNNIGNVYYSQDQYEKALDYYQQDLAISKAIYSDKHPSVAASLTCIGNIYCFQGQYKNALDYHQQALAIQKATYGHNNHPDVAASLNNIGIFYYSQGQYKKALDHYQQALAIQKAIYGHNHPDVAASLNNIGIFYYSQGQYEKALDHYQQALTIDKITYGDNHPSIATSLNNIGNVYTSQYQYKKALDFHQQSLTIRKATYGDNHSEVATSLNNIGNVYYNEYEYEKALEVHQQSLAIRKATYGDNHSEVAISLNNIGSVYYYQEQHEKALDYYQQALSIQRSVHGEKHPDIAASLKNIGLVNKKLEKKSPLLFSKANRQGEEVSEEPKTKEKEKNSWNMESQ